MIMNMPITITPNPHRPPKLAAESFPLLPRNPHRLPKHRFQPPKLQRRLKRLPRLQKHRRLLWKRPLPLLNPPPRLRKRRRLQLKRPLLRLPRLRLLRNSFAARF